MGHSFVAAASSDDLVSISGPTSHGAALDQCHADVPGSSFMAVIDQVLARLVIDGSLQMVDVPRVREHFERLTNRQLSSPPMSPLVAAKEKSPGAKKPSAKSPDGKSPGGKSQPEQSRAAAVTGGDASRTRLAVVPKGVGSRGPGSPSRDSTIAPSLSREGLPSLPPPAIDAKGFALPAPATGGGGGSGSPTLPAREGTPPLSPFNEVSETKNWFRMLEPEAEEEALDLLIAHVAFVDAPVMAFVRCAQPVDAGCESHAPVRYLFILIGPEQECDASTRMAHALAGVMLDEPSLPQSPMPKTPRPFSMRSTHTSRTCPSSHTCTCRTHDPRGGPGQSLHAPGGGSRPATAARASQPRRTPLDISESHSSASEAGPRARTTRTK